MRGSLHNIDQHISPSNEHLPPMGAVNETEGGEGRSAANNKDFRKNPFTLVKKKQLKQITPKNYLKEEVDPADVEPKCKFVWVFFTDYLKYFFFEILC